MARITTLTTEDELALARGSGKARRAKTTQFDEMLLNLKPGQIMKIECDEGEKVLGPALGIVWAAKRQNMLDKIERWSNTSAVFVMLKEAEPIRDALIANDERIDAPAATSQRRNSKASE